MEFKTSISALTETDMIIRGVKLSELISKTSFSNSIFLLLTGRMPKETEAAIFDALLVSCIDHGMGTASSMSTRFVASAGTPLNASVAAGILALGEKHGGAGEQAMLMFEEIMKSVSNTSDQYSVVESYVRQALKKNRTLYGFGHAVYKDVDPRVTQILTLCDDLHYQPKSLGVAMDVAQALESLKSKKICLNVDGLMAALLLDMGFTPVQARGVFIIARTPGLVAQSIEEQQEGKLRRIDEKDITYVKQI